jgi:protein-serine/threonine kinase
MNPYYKGSGLSSSCKSLIRNLLNKNEEKRLGARAGASEVKSHSFFKDKINFALLRNMKPPIIPQKTKPERAVHFNRIKESSSFDLHKSGLNTPPIDKEEQEDPFLSFNSGMFVLVVLGFVLFFD